MTEQLSDSLIGNAAFLTDWLLLWCTFTSVLLCSLLLIHSLTLITHALHTRSLTSTTLRRDGWDLTSAQRHWPTSKPALPTARPLSGTGQWVSTVLQPIRSILFYIVLHHLSLYSRCSCCLTILLHTQLIDLMPYIFCFFVFPSLSV